MRVSRRQGVQRRFNRRFRSLLESKGHQSLPTFNSLMVTCQPIFSSVVPASEELLVLPRLRKPSPSKRPRKRDTARQPQGNGNSQGGRPKKLSTTDTRICKPIIQTVDNEVGNMT
jgi:hypothetical protein